jgi:hypothetical protein
MSILAIFTCLQNYSIETFEKHSIFFKAKEGENFNHPSTTCRIYGAGKNTLSISRIKI